MTIGRAELGYVAEARRVGWGAKYPHLNNVRELSGGSRVPFPCSSAAEEHALKIDL
jgi:hypothetical protein